MRQDSNILTITRVPARLTAKQTADLLGFCEHDIPVLVAKGHLKPLANPAPNAQKFFAAQEIIALAADINWLSRATRCLYEFHRARNTKHKSMDKTRFIT